MHRPDDKGVTTRGQKAFRVTLGQLSTLPVIAAGISLWVGKGGGLYWLVAGLLFLLVNGIAHAWILLVEILR